MPGTGFEHQIRPHSKEERERGGRERKRDRGLEGGGGGASFSAFTYAGVNGDLPGSNKAAADPWKTGGVAESPDVTSCTAAVAWQGPHTHSTGQGRGGGPVAAVGGGPCRTCWRRVWAAWGIGPPASDCVGYGRSPLLHPFHRCCPPGSASRLPWPAG